MVKCGNCGQEFVKEKQLEVIKKKLGTDSLEKLCDKCKRISTAEKLKDVVKNSPR